MNIVTPEEAGFSSVRLQRLNDLMQGYTDSGRLAGTVTLLAREGKVFHFERFGHQDLASQKPMELDTIFRFYSMTKPITSAAVMMLYEEGNFHLDDPVSDFIPELDGLKVYDGMGQTGPKFVPQQSAITIRHLLTHTAGLSYGFYEDSPVEQMYRDANLGDPDSNLTEMIDKLSELPLVTQPGSAWRYSNATDVLGRLVEVISGESFDSFLNDMIFDPLGMDDTAFYVTEDKLDRLASIYGPSENGGIKELDNPGVNKFKRPVTNFSGGGGLTSTAADYLKFCQMMLSGGTLNGERLLGPKTVEMMTSNHLSDDLMPFSVSESGADASQGCGFGLGFRVITDIAEHGTIGTEGSKAWGGAASTVFWIDPVEDLIAIMLTQFMPSSQYPIRREFQVATYQAMVE
ncbi:MAG: beta-lactamase family protein [Chloroflexi bacterium]|nr:beta-lactamase family protein [Chloroflexota bacterium]